MGRSWNGRERVLGLWGSGWANPVVRAAVGHTCRAHTPCLNPLWLLLHKQYRCPDLDQPGVLSAKSTWPGMFKSPSPSALNFTLTSALAVLFLNGGRGGEIWKTHNVKVKLRAAEKPAHTHTHLHTHEREWERDDEILSVGTRFCSWEPECAEAVGVMQSQWNK